MLDFKKELKNKGGSSIIIYITGTKLTILNNTFYCLKQPVFRSLGGRYVLYSQKKSKKTFQKSVTEFAWYRTL